MKISLTILAIAAQLLFSAHSQADSISDEDRKNGLFSLIKRSADFSEYTILEDTFSSSPKVNANKESSREDFWSNLFNLFNTKEYINNRPYSEETHEVSVLLERSGEEFILTCHDVLSAVTRNEPRRCIYYEDCEIRLANDENEWDGTGFQWKDDHSGHQFMWEYCPETI